MLRIGQRDAELGGLVVVPPGALAAFECRLPKRFVRNAKTELPRCGNQPAGIAALAQADTDGGRVVGQIGPPGDRHQIVLSFCRAGA